MHMRMRDGRFKEKRVRLPLKDLNFLLESIKQEKKYVPTSKEIETFLKKNESINMKLPWYGPMV